MESTSNNSSIDSRDKNDNNNNTNKNNGNTNKKERLTLRDWYELCEKFSRAKERLPSLSRNAFLRSEESGPKFQDTQTMRNGFHRSLKKYKSGELKPGNLMRLRSRKYHPIEDKLLHYMSLYAGGSSPQIAFPEIKRLCLKWARELGFDHFRCSNKWISDALGRRAKIAEAAVTPNDKRGRTISESREPPQDHGGARKRHAAASDAPAMARVRIPTVVVEEQQQQQQQPPKKNNATAMVRTQQESAVAAILTKTAGGGGRIHAAAAAASIKKADGNSYSNSTHFHDAVSLEQALASLAAVQNYCKTRKVDDASHLLQIVEKFMLEKG